jgi:hypothetical protein
LIEEEAWWRHVGIMPALNGRFTGVRHGFAHHPRL